MEEESHITRNIFLWTTGLGMLSGIGYLGYQNYLLEQAGVVLRVELLSAQQDADRTSRALAENIESLKQLLATSQSDKESIEKSMNAQLRGMEETLGLYQKLATTDQQLLAKYSRVYFLSDNYSPKYTAQIPGDYLSDPTKEILMLRDAWPFLKKMLDDAATEGVDLKIISAYRSFDTQTKLKNAYTVVYGTSANKFSADQGYSEHQLGTAIDFTTSVLGINYSTFEKTASYAWLTANAYKYGFVLSYPKSNAYYIFEPWHWRFVGKTLALRLHDEQKNFVDMDQRDLNEYIIPLFNDSPLQQ